MDSLAQNDIPTPDKLYKFRTSSDARVFDRDVRTLLMERRLYLPSPHDLNDPADVRPVVGQPTPEVFEGLVERLCTAHPQDDVTQIREFVRGQTYGEEPWDKWADKLFEDTFSQYGILSFSANPQSASLWTHYASNFRGYAVGYRGRASADFEAVPALPVTYRKERSTFAMLSNGTDEEILGILATKSKDWEYEEEWRFIRDKQNGGVGFFDVPKGAILEVLLGPEMLPTQREVVVRLARELPDKPQILQGSYARRRFGLVFTPIIDP